MTSLSSILRGRRRSGAETTLKKAVFVCYGGFDCNSAGHIAGFAAELARHGLAVAVCGRDHVLEAYAFGPPAFEFFTLGDLRRDPHGVIGFDGAVDAAATVMICWTPRKASRVPTLKVARALGVPYIVHFEDNEDHLSALRFGEDAAAAASSPKRRALR